MSQNQKRSRSHGYLAVDGQVGGFPCMVKDISAEGAVLSLTGLMGIPSRFSLFIEPDGVKFGCIVTKTRGNSVAVAFESREENKRFRDHVKAQTA